MDFRLGTPTYRPYQKLQLEFEVRITPGLHVYGLPVPEGYTPLAVEVEPLEGMELGPLKLPEPRPFRVEGLDEQFYVYEGTVHGSMPIVLTKNLGEVTLRTKTQYQACTDALCYPPDVLVAELRLTGVDVIRD
ncbi:MAG TPA: protein-disulfide reductase DsbD N-terminal domain-containing protein [Chloroflexota bacterium]